jgi:hypothetical protein
MEPDAASPATAATPDQPPAETPRDGGREGGELDLAAMGLAVFFVAVIAVVVALLLVQNLF